jgi:predicted dehydrogenase
MKKNFFHPIHYSRRNFLKGFGYVIGSVSIGLPSLSLTACNSAGGRETKTQTGGENKSNAQDRKLGIALVGLGNYSSNQLAPALQETDKCYLAGIVTGTPSKAESWKQQYNIPEKNIYNYDNYDQIANNPDIDIIYVVLPNGMHAEYTIRAAEAGKHVICEKPMATSVEDCERMISACERNNVMLSIGYRLHYEPYNQRVMELGQEEVFGPVEKIDTGNSFVIGNDPDSWRVDKELAGGGPLMDMGIYCVQGACYTTGEEPVAVTARFGEVTRPRIFDEVEQSIHWQMEFPSGAVADCSSSYNERESYLHAEAENGWWKLDSAYGYSGQHGRTSEGPMDFPDINQQRRQMDAFANCVINNRPTKVPGEMGKRDVRIMMAIYEAARSGNRVTL